MRQLADEERGCSKTGQFDEGVLLDLPRHRCIVHLLAMMSAGRPKSSPLVPMAAPDLAKFMQDFGVRLRLPFRPLPYQLRHTGASTDMAERARPLSDIKRRGRWQADSSVKRYEKAAILTRVFNSLNVEAQSFCLLSAKELPEVIYGKRVIRCLG